MSPDTTPETTKPGTTLRDFMSREAAQAANPRSHGEGKLISIDLIDANPFQPRQVMDPAKLDELVESIRANGLIEPVPVRKHPVDPGRYQLIAGHRRHTAFKTLRDAATVDADRLQWSQILAVEKAGITDRKMRILGVVENGDRDDVSPLEQGIALVSLMENEKLSREQLIEETGWAEDRIKRLLRIAKAPQVVKDACSKGIMVQLYDDAGSPLTTPKGRLAQEHRHLDLMGALAFDQLYRHYTKTGASEKKASERVEKHINTALTDGWGYRRIKDYVADQMAPNVPKAGASADASTPSQTAGEGTAVPTPETPNPYRDDERQLVIYKGRIAGASSAQKAALRSAIQELLKLLNT